MQNEIEVLTKNGTTGIVDPYSVEYEDVEELVGQRLNVHFRDENGNDDEFVDEIVEIL